jgi:hypothetical protein
LEENVEGNGRGLFQSTLSAFAKRDLRMIGVSTMMDQKLPEYKSETLLHEPTS